MHYIAVLDCNNFFVSCERLFRPDLRQVPVVVLSSNDGCVVARSQEVKDSGVPMGAPLFQVKDILKDIGAVCFSSHFTLYRDISARVFAVVSDYCGEIEQYSIDEAFFVYEAATDEEAHAYVQTLKSVVERAVGIPVSIGVSDTKTRAKLVNAYAKKNTGVAVFCGDQFRTQFGASPLAAVWGVGRQLATRYRALGIETVDALIEAPSAVVREQTHQPGCALQSELAGRVVNQVSSGRSIPKSIMSTRSFATKTNDPAVLKDALAYHVRNVFEDLRAQKLVATGIRVLLETSRHSDWRFYGGTRETFFAEPTNDTTYGLQTAIMLLNDLYEGAVPYSKTGVVVYGLMPTAYVTGGLFTPTVTETSTIDDVLDTLNARFGRATVQVGMFAKSALWQARGERRSPAYTTDWSALQIVHTTDKNGI